MSVAHKIIVLISVLLLISAAGCTPKEPQISELVPTGIISQDSMVSLMTECYLAEGAIKQIQVEHKNVVAHTHSYYTVIFKKYNTTYEKYKESLRYYYQYPETAEKMYDEVLENLAKIESEIKSGKEDSSKE